MQQGGFDTLLWYSANTTEVFLVYRWDLIISLRQSEHFSHLISLVYQY